ncbi:MAG: hypothetical protein KDA80_14805 [Planctomycetaceae bacterium]|nr:hypothetical protein [Planctomycetaceae bacterium]
MSLVINEEAVKMKWRPIVTTVFWLALIGICFWHFYQMTAIPHLEKRGVDFRRLSSGVIWEAHLGKPNFGDPEIRQLLKLNSLESVSLKDTSVTANGIRSLAQLPHLRELKLSTTPVDERIFAAINSLSSLTSVSFGNCSGISAERLKVFAGHPRLKSILLIEAPMDYAELVDLEQTLDTIAIAIDVRDVVPIPRSYHLRCQWDPPGSRNISISFSPNTISGEPTKIDANLIEKLPTDGVTSLSIPFPCRVTEEIGPALSELRRLSHLQLQGEITDTLLEAIARLERLNSLSLTGSLPDELQNDSKQAVTDGGVSALNRLRKLEKLDLASLHLKPGAFAALKGLPHLQDLSVSQCGVRDEDLTSLGTFPRLEKLSLPYNHLTDASREPLLQLTKLTRLGVGANQMTTAIVDELTRSPQSHLQTRNVPETP